MPWDMTLNPGDIAAIEHAVPKESAVGSRHPKPLMAALDGERNDKSLSLSRIDKRGGYKYW